MPLKSYYRDTACEEASSGQESPAYLGLKGEQRQTNEDTQRDEPVKLFISV